MSPGTLELTLANATPSQPTTMFVSLGGRAKIPLGPCDILLGLPAPLTIGGMTTAAGTYTSGALPVPASLKAVINLQALILDPTTAFGGSLSNGLELHYN